MAPDGVVDVWKVLLTEQVVTLVGTGVFAGSPDDLRDGFIHLSTAAQIEGTLARHFSGEGNLFAACCPVERLGAGLRWEPSRGGALFPHLYRPLALADVAAILPVPARRDGWPPKIP